MIATAAWLVATAYVAVFVVFSRRAARMAGRSIWLFASGDARQVLTAWLFRIAFAGVALWPPMTAFMHWGSAAAGAPDVLRAAGLLACFAGAAIALVAQIGMGRSWRIGTAAGALGPIVDSGLFAWSRNPAFVGQALLFVGAAVATSDIVVALCALCCIVAIAIQVPIEERALLATFGEPYRAYMQRVRRWL